MTALGDGLGFDGDRPSPRPRGKAARRAAGAVPSRTVRLVEAVFGAINRNRRAIAAVNRATDLRLTELERVVAQLGRDVHAARALYYDTHDSVTGEHVGGSVWEDGDDGDDARRPR